MIIIIDGYNVLKPASQKGDVTDRQRIRFAQELSAYARQRGHHIVLVFDGFLSDDDADGGNYKYVSVLYSGARESADDVIKRKVDQYRGRDAVVVTSDRELCRYAERHGLEAIDSYDFYRIIKADEAQRQVVHKHQQAVKISQDSDHEELDQLMKEVNVRGTKDPEVDYDPFEDHKKLSKKERKIARIIKKL